MKISIGCDHRGFTLKQQIIDTFTSYMLEEKEHPIEWLDVGCENQKRCDYPIYAKQVTKQILDNKADFGVLICGSGIGMAIAANRFPHIYAALCWSEELAEIAYEDDGVNVLVLSSDYVANHDNIEIVRTILMAWIHKTFKEGRYQERLDMIDAD